MTTIIIVIRRKRWRRSTLPTTKLVKTADNKMKVAMAMIKMMTTPTIVIMRETRQPPVLFISQFITDTISTNM